MFPNLSNHLNRDDSKYRSWNKISMASSFVSVVSTLVLGSGTAFAVWTQDPATASDQPALIINASIDDRLEYNIPAQSLRRALLVYGKLTGLQVSADPARVAGIMAPAIRGKFTPQQALDKLLSGTKLSPLYVGKTGVIVTIPNRVYAQAGDGTQLDTIVVDTQTVEDKPFTTPGSTSHISKEDLERVAPTSPGDIFKTTPGVISAGGRMGTSINPNIRGLQGQGRVNTTIDGARQNTTSYHSYYGTRDETYFDPDMIGGVDITKGPSDGVGVGGIGGTITLRTLEAVDIVKPGASFGFRLKGSLTSNSFKERSLGTTTFKDRPSFLNGDWYSGSMAAAWDTNKIEFITAYSQRRRGNYFVGTKIPDGIRLPSTTPFSYTGPKANAVVEPGEEAFNTSENTESFLAKTKLKFSDGHSLQFGYLFYDSVYGNIDPFKFTPYGTPEQLDLAETRVHTYTTKYRYNPSDNPFINFKANLSLSDVYTEGVATTLQPYGNKTWGGDITNSSIFETALGELTWTNGLEFSREHATAIESIDVSQTLTSYSPMGVRLMTSAFSKVSLDFTDWLTVSGGARFDYFESEGEGHLAQYPDQSGDRISPNFGVVVTPFEGVQLYGQYIEGYRPPSLRESHWNYQTLLNVNPDIKPELSKNYEFGLNILKNDIAFRNDKLRFKASYFNNRYDDYIGRGPLPGHNPTNGNKYQWDNIDHATYQGFELSGKYDTGQFFFEGAYTKYNKIEYCITAGNCGQAGAVSDWGANYIPPDTTASITTGVRLMDEKLTLGGRMTYSTERIGSSCSICAIDSLWPEYTVYDLFGSYKFNEDTIVNFSVENIFDDYYFGALSTVGIASPGRTARISMTTKFGENTPTSAQLLAPFGILSSESLEENSWTGLYVGGFFGYGLGDHDQDIAKGASPSDEGGNHFDLKDPVRGVQLGFNYQLQNRVVLGIEGDFTWLGKDYKEKTDYQSQEVLQETYVDFQRTLSESTLETELDWLSTLRLRAGYAWSDKFMFYGTGGVAFMKQKEYRTQFEMVSRNRLGTDYHFTAPFSVESLSSTRVGFSVGAGLEYEIADGWSLKAEYLYTGFKDVKSIFKQARKGVTHTKTTTTGGNTLNPVCIFGQPQTFPIPGNFASCFITTPVVTTVTPGTVEEVQEREVSNDIDLHSLRVGLVYRF